MPNSWKYGIGKFRLATLGPHIRTCSIWAATAPSSAPHCMWGQLLIFRHASAALNAPPIRRKTEGSFNWADEAIYDTAQIERNSLLLCQLLWPCTWVFAIFALFQTNLVYCQKSSFYLLYFLFSERQVIGSFAVSSYCRGPHKPICDFMDTLFPPYGAYDVVYAGMSTSN